jgi:hypothetical protein
VHLLLKNVLAHRCTLIFSLSIGAKRDPNKQTQNKMKSHILVHGPVEYVFNHRSTYKQDFIAIRSFKFQSLVISFRDRSKHVQEPSFSQMRDFWSAASMFAQSYLSSH